MKFRSAALTHVGCVRAANEDALYCGANLFVVADGMGGHDSGEVASAAVVDALASLDAPQSPAALASAAAAALRQVNADLVRLAGERGRGAIGATVVALAAGAEGFVCLWAGDSRAYRLREGALERLTRDHSLVQALVDAGELAPEQAATHPHANIVTRAVGAAAELEAAERRGDVAAGDVFVLASDGLTRLVAEVELGEAIGAPDPEEAARRLLDLALERGAPDNVSVIVARAVA